MNCGPLRHRFPKGSLATADFSATIKKQRPTYDSMYPKWKLT